MATLAINYLNTPKNKYFLDSHNKHLNPRANDLPNTYIAILTHLFTNTIMIKIQTIFLPCVILAYVSATETLIA